MHAEKKVIQPAAGLQGILSASKELIHSPMSLISDGCSSFDVLDFSQKKAAGWSIMYGPAPARDPLAAGLFFDWFWAGIISLPWVCDGPSV